MYVVKLPLMDTLGEWNIMWLREGVYIMSAFWRKLEKMFSITRQAINNKLIPHSTGCTSIPSFCKSSEKNFLADIHLQKWSITCLSDSFTHHTSRLGCFPANLIKVRNTDAVVILTILFAVTHLIFLEFYILIFSLNVKYMRGGIFNIVGRWINS